MQPLNYTINGLKIIMMNIKNYRFQKKSDQKLNPTNLKVLFMMNDLQKNQMVQQLKAMKKN